MTARPPKNRGKSLDLPVHGCRRAPHHWPESPQRVPNAAYESSYLPASTCNIATGNPYKSGCLVNAGNVSLALHYLRGPNEFYFVYGNANNLNTEPSLFVKWILYVGAQKGQ
jgi:hypothetical protein